MQKLVRTVGRAFATLLLVLAGGSGIRAEDAGDRSVEIRAAWIHPSWDWRGDTVAQRREQMIASLNRLSRANINLLFPWVESKHALQLLGDPLYRSERSVYDTRQWDVLQELIDAAEERGMEVHLWYSFTRYKRGRDAPEYNPDLSVMPPGNRSWSSIRKSEYLNGHTDPADAELDANALCANELDAHRWTLTLLERLLEKYPGLKGLQIEEPGYLSLERCVCRRCQQRYAQLYDEPGSDLLDHVHSELEGYREDERAVPVKTFGTDAFVQQLYRWMEQQHPDKILSFNGGPDVWSDQMRGRNWGQWAQAGLLRFYSPQCYQPNVAGFRRYVRGAMAALKGTGTEIVPGIGVQYGNGPHTNTPDVVLQQVTAARELAGTAGVSYAGISFFKGSAISRELADVLRNGPFKEPARLPWQAEMRRPPQDTSP